MIPIIFSLINNASSFVLVITKLLCAVHVNLYVILAIIGVQHLLDIVCLSQHKDP